MNAGQWLALATEMPPTGAARPLSIYEASALSVIRAAGCDLIGADGRHVLDLYAGDAVSNLGYAHPRLVDAIRGQSERLLFQDNLVDVHVRDRATNALVGFAPPEITGAFLVNCGAEANENALRIAFLATGRRKVLAVTGAFHGRTAAAGAVSWNARQSWYGFPKLPFDVEFIPRNDIDALTTMIDNDVAAVIFEPVQGRAGAVALSFEFVAALRQATRSCAAILIADEVCCGMGRAGQHFAVDAYGVQPDIITAGKALAGGYPCGAVLLNDDLGALLQPGDLASTFGGGPTACAAMLAVIDAIRKDGLLANVRRREADIREHCVRGPVRGIQGMGLLLGLRCDRPAREVQSALLHHDILAGLCDDPDVLSLSPPLILQAQHVERLSEALGDVAPAI